MDITYRPAKPEDLGEAERVVQQSGNALRVRHGRQPWPAPPPIAFPKFCLAQDPSGLWVAQDGDTIVGFGFSWITEKFWCLSQLKPKPTMVSRSEEHTSELQSLTNLVCRLLLEKKKKNRQSRAITTRKRKHQTRAH